MFRALIIFVALAMASAFAPTRMLARTNMALNEEMGKSKVTGNECPQRKIDKNGRCPGESGYVSFTKADNRTLAEITADRVSIPISFLHLFLLNVFNLLLTLSPFHNLIFPGSYKYRKLRRPPPRNKCIDDN